MPATDLSEEWSEKLTELASAGINTDSSNTVHAHVTDSAIGEVALVSHLKDGEKEYVGFSAVLKKDNLVDGDYQWLQFITRQLVVNGTHVPGNLVVKTNNLSYQLVQADAEITDFETDQVPNWSTAWKVDGGSSDSKIFFANEYEFAKKENESFALLDKPSQVVGKSVADLMDILKPSYLDLPETSTAMKTELSPTAADNVARAYFSDYLLEKGQGDNNGKWVIKARLDFSLTWSDCDPNHLADHRGSYTLNCFYAEASTKLLPCHKGALEHRTTPGNGTEGNQPFNDFLTDKLVYTE